MIDALIIYALSCYMVYYVVGQSDLLATPRAWVLRTLPGWLTYPLSCSLCFTFWLSLALTLTGVVYMGALTLLAAPVVNLLLDMGVKALIRANEPPVIAEGKTITSGDQSITAWRGGDVMIGTVGPVSVRAGEMVHITSDTPPPMAVDHGDGIKIPDSMRFINLAANEKVPPSPSPTLSRASRASRTAPRW